MQKLINTWTFAEDNYDQLELRQLVDHSIQRKLITYLSV